MTAEYPDRTDQWCEKTKTYFFEWNLGNFDCATHRPIITKLPSTQFDFLVSLCNISVNLSLEGDSCKSRKLTFKLSPLNDVYVKSILRFGSQLFIDEQYTSSRFLIHRLALYDSNGECFLLAANNTITCEIYCEWYTSTTREKIPIIESEFSKNFAELFETKKYSDVTFDVAGKEFYAHKSILASRCHVLDTMFTHQMKESISNKVVIEDIEPEVFNEFLRFIYTDNVQNLKQNAVKLLAASDKYDQPRLRSICERELASTIRIDTAAEILITADLHNSNALKVIAQDYINRNKEGVSKTNGWKELVQNHFELLCNLYLRN